MKKFDFVINLPDGWKDCSEENPGGPPTFIRTASESPGVLQCSMELYAGGEKPQPDEDGLVKMAINVACEQDWGEFVKSDHGKCAFGIYGTAIFKSAKHNHMQVWYLSNGLDFILVTLISDSNASSQKALEAQNIVKKLNIKPKTWWKIW